MPENKPFNPFPTAKEERTQGDVAAQTIDAQAYRLAFLDQDFLVREELRPMRLQLELLKPELSLRDRGIQSTIVVFGSARIPSPEQAIERLQKAEASLLEDPEDPDRQRLHHTATRLQYSARYYHEARRFAKHMGDLSRQTNFSEHVIITGGGPGIMEAANRGAHDAGAPSISLNIVLPHERPNPYVTPELSFQFHYFAIRKMHFLIRARALVAFPGGFGTLDELFEALTLVQTRKISALPIVLFGEDYWKRAVNFDVLVEEGMIHPEDLRLFQYVETAEEAIAIIQHFYETPSSP